MACEIRLWMRKHCPSGFLLHDDRYGSTDQKAWRQPSRIGQNSARTSALVTCKVVLTT